jgi:hypothetical protein
MAYGQTERAGEKALAVGPQDTYRGLRAFPSNGARKEGRGQFTFGSFFGLGRNDPDGPRK